MRDSETRLHDSSVDKIFKENYEQSAKEKSLQTLEVKNEIRRNQTHVKKVVKWNSTTPMVGINLTLFKYIAYDRLITNWNPQKV